MNQIILREREYGSLPEQKGRFDALIYSIGYEKRSCFVARTLKGMASEVYGIAFPDQQIESFSDNLAWAQRHALRIQQQTEEQFDTWFREWLVSGVIRKEEPLRICIDISSMTRSRIAVVVTALAQTNLNRPVFVDFCYAPALFEPPPLDEDPVASHSPISPFFAGWSQDPEAPIAAVVGLGYEHARALGAVEYFEASEVWLFNPIGEDKRFDIAVLGCNEQLITDTPTGRLVDYSVTDPLTSFVELESLLYALAPSYRPIVVPFGPKIFTLLALLVAVVHHPHVSVWRISSGTLGHAVDREASGTITTLGVDVLPSRGLMLTTEATVVE